MAIRVVFDFPQLFIHQFFSFSSSSFSQFFPQFIFLLYLQITNISMLVYVSDEWICNVYIKEQKIV